MKLASLKSGRDGQLVVVSDDLAWYAEAGHIAATLQQALDDWDHLSPRLDNLATDLAHGVIPKFRFHEREAAAPLPRAYQWVEGVAPANPVGPDRQAQAQEPLIRQGGSDRFLGPRDAITLLDESWDCDFGAQVVVVTGDVPPGVSVAVARDHILLVGLANAVSLSGLVPGELASGFGLFQSRPADSFSPVFVTPDTLGAGWDGGKLHGMLSVDVNGGSLCRVDAGDDMAFDFGQLIAHAARTRGLGAGTIIGSGPGPACLAQARAAETMARGKPQTPMFKQGDTIRIWLEDDKRHPVFGVIEHSVIPN
ncbi:MAG: hypothetical protein RL367_2091 [Pseudomonadota bacterium]